VSTPLLPSLVLRCQLSGVMAMRHLLETSERCDWSLGCADSLPSRTFDGHLFPPQPFQVHREGVESEKNLRSVVGDIRIWNTAVPASMSVMTPETLNGYMCTCFSGVRWSRHPHFLWMVHVNKSKPDTSLHELVLSWLVIRTWCAIATVDELEHLKPFA